MVKVKKLILITFTTFMLLTLLGCTQQKTEVISTDESKDSFCFTIWEKEGIFVEKVYSCDLNGQPVFFRDYNKVILDSGRTYYDENMVPLFICGGLTKAEDEDLRCDLDCNAIIVMNCLD